MKALVGRQVLAAMTARGLCMGIFKEHEMAVTFNVLFLLSHYISLLRRHRLITYKYEVRPSDLLLWMVSFIDTGSSTNTALLSTAVLSRLSVPVTSSQTQYSHDFLILTVQQ